MRRALSSTFAKAALALAVIAVAGAAAALTGANATPSAGPDGPSVTRLPDVAPKVFRGSVRGLPQVGPGEQKERPKPRAWEDPDLGMNAGPKSPLAGAQEPAAAATVVAGPAPAPGSGAFAGSFAGLDSATWGAGWPPDTNGDAGPADFVEAVNTSIGIYRKTDGARLAAFTFNSLWKNAGTGTACDTTNQGDPTVTYDPIGDHFFVADFAFTGSTSTPPFYECIAVSRTGDPVNGGWWFYAVRGDDSAHPYFPDYPKMGIWPDALYMSANMFGSSFKEVRVWAFNRADLESGATLRSVVADTNTTSYFSLLPGNMRTAAGAPPSGRDAFFVSESQTAYAFQVFRFHVDFSGSGSSFTGPTNVSQGSYTVVPSTIPSPGNKLDSLGDRLMNSAQYSNIGGAESLWVNHSTSCCGASSPAGIQWAQIDVSGGTVKTTPVQQQVYPGTNDGLNRWMGSVAVDKLGDMALGYSVSSSTLNPDIRYAGRLAGDAAGTLPLTETSMLPGVTRGTQLGNCGGSTCIRWGDYSSMTLDPNGCDFWYAQEYYATTGMNWQTRIGSFRLNPSCGSGTQSQTISFSQLADKTYGDADFAVSATASSGLPVTFSAADNCTVSGNVVHLTGAGTCTITASQAGNATYAPAADVSQSFSIAQATQTISFGTIADHPYGTDFTVGATASSALAVSFSASGTCTVGGNVVHPTSVGACTITASQPGNANYKPATDVSQPVNIVQGSQTIAFAAIPDHVYGDPDFTVGATASSGLAVSFAAAGDCTVVGNLVHLTAPGSCTITASQGGDSNWQAAADVPRTFAIASTPTGTPLTISANTEGSLTFQPGAWVSGGWHVKLSQASTSPVTVTLSGNVQLPVRCSSSASAPVAGTISVPVSTTITIPANTTNWYLTNDQKALAGWMGAVQAPAFCGSAGVMYSTQGATLTGTAQAGPHTGTLGFQFHYRVPAALRKPNTDCTDASDPNHNNACTAKWSGTVSP